MGADGVDQHGALANQQFTGPVHYQDALLLDALHRDEAHGLTASQMASASAASFLPRFT